MNSCDIKWMFWRKVKLEVTVGELQKLTDMIICNSHLSILSSKFWINCGYRKWQIFSFFSWRILSVEWNLTARQMKAFACKKIKLVVDLFSKFSWNNCQAYFMYSPWFRHASLALLYCICPLFSQYLIKKECCFGCLNWIELIYYVCLKHITESLISFIMSVHLPACLPASNSAQIADLYE